MTGRRGRTGFGVRRLAECVIIMTEEGLSMRDMVAYLHARPVLFGRVGLDDIPTRSTLVWARRRLSTPYRHGRNILTRGWKQGSF